MMKYLSIIFIFLIGIVSVQASSNQIMNGYRLKNFKDFEKKWKFVTVRYRKDSGEMRFVYANELAWKALEKNETDYPNGAVFAKISILTEKDEAFPSSMVPSGSRRVQFMVRDKEKHQETYGWGYALFRPNGERFPGNPREKSMACAACHQIVPDRGQVFSQSMSLAQLNESQRGEETSWYQRIKFSKLKVQKISENIKILLPSKTEFIYSIEGSLQRNLFAGTLDEIRPLLVEQVLKTNSPAALISEDKKLFSIVYPQVRNDCSEATHRAMHAIVSVPDNSGNVLRINLCEKI